jgi:hypothetical protein
MRDPEMVARAGYAAARLEQAWERWRALHGLSGSSDSLASYVGYSNQEPMGQPRVVIGVDAAEAEFFADFLEGHDCAAPGPAGQASASPAASLPRAGLPAAGAPAAGLPGAGLPANGLPASGPATVAEVRPVNGSNPGRLPVNGSNSPLDSGSLYPPVSGPQPVMANGTPRPAEASVAMSRGAGPSGPMGIPSREAPAAVTTVANGSGPGATPAPRDVPSEPMARLTDDTDPLARTAPPPERPVTAPQAPLPPVPPVTRAFPAPVPTFTPIGETGPGGLTAEPRPGDPRGGLDRPAGPPPDVIAAELAGWASGELPGQASEQLASWAAADAPGGRALNRSRSAR